MEQEKTVIIVPFVSLNLYVKRCIRWCLKLNYSNFQLILLPNEPIRLPDKLRAQCIVIIPTGDIAIARKRNIAINRFPDFDYYAFIDSDAYPHPDWLQNGIKAFQKSDIIWAVGGPHIEPHDEPFRHKVVGNALKSILVSGLSAFCKKVSKNRYCSKLQTCNLIVKKEAIKLTNGFNERLELGEDQEFCNRIGQKGGKIFFDNTVIVYHSNRAVGLHFLLQRLAYGFYTFKIFKEYKSLFNLLFFIPLFIFIFLVIGLILGIYNHAIMSIWITIFVMYGSMLLFETIRHSGKIKEMPLTLVAMLIGTWGYILGSLLAMLNIRIDIKGIYKNYNV